MVGERKSLLQRVLESDPVLVRGVIVAVFGLVAMVTTAEYAEGTIETVVNGAISALALLAALWSRSKVTPNGKVVTYMPSPEKRPGVVVPGQANDSVVSTDSDLLKGGRDVDPYDS